MNGKLFPELLASDHLLNGRNRGLGALIPPLECWFLQAGTVVHPGGFIPSEPSGQGPLEISPEWSVMRVMVTTMT